MAELTVLFDEDCGICGMLARALAQRGIAVAPIGSATGAALLRDLTPRERYASVHAVDGVGRRTSAAAAMPAIARCLPAGRITSALLAVAPRLTARCYRGVARNRGRISRLLGVGSSCSPEPNDASLPGSLAPMLSAVWRRDASPRLPRTPG